MKRLSFLTVTFLTIGFLAACSSESSSDADDTEGTDDSDDNDDSDDSEDEAASYATFGVTLSNVLPAGLKVGGVNSEESLRVKAELSGSCAEDYTDCPAVTASGGGDSTAGEILMRLWGLDYNDECTEDLLTSGGCFDCVDCQTGSVGTTNFIQPTMIEDPAACAATSTTDGHYVNMGVDPCFFDATIAQISNIAECEAIEGGEVDVSSAIPWYASWGIPQTVNFSSYDDRSDGGLWWTVNDGTGGADQYFLSLDSDWLYAGVKNEEEDTFLFLGTGSPDYYDGLGEGSGVNISAYTGPLSAITTTFEAIQVRDQDPNSYIERLRSNGTHLWFQQWMNDDFPETPDEVDAVKDSPSLTRCLEIGTSVVTSRYVPLDDCVDSFGVASLEELNQDSNYTLKVIDGETAGSIDFTTPLTETTSSSCLEEESTE